MSASLYIATFQAANRGLFGISLVGGKRAEVVLANKRAGGLAHGGKIKHPRHMPGGMANQRIHRRMVPNEIAILLAFPTEAPLKTGRPAHRGNHPDVLRQPRI